MGERNRVASRQMKASELCRESGMSRSAIHYYVNLGLLHRPAKAGLNLHLYDETHLARLRRIRELKEKKGLSLAEIKQVLEPGKTQGRTGPSLEPTLEDRQPLERYVRGQGETTAREDQEHREKIMDMAIQLFSERGYENTKISDITEALRMGKSTFYLYFKNKRALFMECIDRLSVIIVPPESWDEIRNERDYFRKNYTRGLAFLKAFPGYRGILNMIRGAVGRDDPALAKKAIESFRVLSRPMLKDLRRAAADGTVRIRHDEAFSAYLHLVMAESFGYWQMIDPRYSVEEGMEIIMDIMRHGIVDANPTDQTPATEKGPEGEVEDSTGKKTRLADISVDRRGFLRGRMGEAEVDVVLSRLDRVRFVDMGTRHEAALKMRDGQEFVIDVDAEISLEGRASFGSVRIPLKRIASVSLGPGN
jgi:AcrR family transcriptional regulator